jgi:hypothetical protein
MKRKYLGLMLLAILTLSISCVFITNAQATTVLSMNPAVIPTQSLSVGSTFTVTFHIANVQNLWQWGFELKWNPQVLTVDSPPTEGPFLRSAGNAFFNTPPLYGSNITLGVLNETSCMFFTLAKASGSGDLASIVFKVVGYGSSNIDFNNAFLGATPADSASESLPITFTQVGSTFNLPNPNQPTPTPSPSPTPTPPPSGSVHGPSASFLPADGTFYTKGDMVTLDASQSTSGLDTVGVNESCPITNYAWRIEYLNGTVFTALSGRTVNFTIQTVNDLRVILIVTAPDPTAPSSPNYVDTDTASAFLYVQSSSQSGNIDVYLDKGGEGKNSASRGAYGPQDLIHMYAKVTYHNSSIANKDVVFTVYSANASMIVVRVGRTNSTGIASADFRLPWPDTANPESVFGVWSTVASVDLSENSLNDSVSFNYNYIVSAKTIQVPSAAVHRLDNVPINITLNSINDLPLTSTVIVTVYDSQKIPIGCYTTPNVRQNQGNTTITVTINIPSWAYLGQATVYVNVLTDSVDHGGKPYGKEQSAVFQIQ